MSKLHLVEVATPEASRLELPEHVQLSLAEIAGAAKEGLLALAVGTGLVLQETIEWEVERVVGVKGRHSSQRTAKRHGHMNYPGSVDTFWLVGHGRAGHPRADEIGDDSWVAC